MSGMYTYFCPECGYWYMTTDDCMMTCKNCGSFRLTSVYEISDKSIKELREIVMTKETNMSHEHPQPDYYKLKKGDRVWTARDAIALLDGLDHFEAWAIGDAMAYMVRAGRKTPDAKADLDKARDDLIMALEHRDRRRIDEMGVCQW